MADKKKSNIQVWFESLTPEQQEAHKAKMAIGRKRYRGTKVKPEPPGVELNAGFADPTPPPSLTPLPVEPLTRAQAIAPEYASLFRKLLGEYQDILACMTGGGTYTTDYCKLCVQSGIHGVGGKCGCPCHRARAALASFDE